MKTVRLTDIYSIRQLRDKTERLHQYLSPDCLRKKFVVQAMRPRALKQLLANPLDTVLDAYNEYATEEQEALIARKMEHFDTGRIIVVAGDYLVDGNHHVIAAIRLAQPVQYIDLRA